MSSPEGAVSETRGQTIELWAVLFYFVLIISAIIQGLNVESSQSDFSSEATYCRYLMLKKEFYIKTHWINIELRHD